ncbi:hypothetical protein CVV65_07925 [Kyrpidia spormannii]|uniref:Uncharacterized protein n=3 Tax=Alicyclobacillaceae TaxID=186823 RepID=A0A2K8N699_9BACL|nr:hypothetical protein CVV65_07925 [Kyrpidia spormannii]CAB3392106.1 conserved protein of unknown function [Kyrpidia spormannii]CAB3393026.1 conserved protein of unknown function [Kyrpidia spormannii]
MPGQRLGSTFVELFFSVHCEEGARLLKEAEGMLLGDIEVARWEEMKTLVDTLAVGGAPLCTDPRGQVGLYARVASEIVIALEQRLSGRVLRLPVMLLEDGVHGGEFLRRARMWKQRLGCTGPLVAVGVEIPGFEGVNAEDEGDLVLLSLTGEQVLAQTAAPGGLDHAVGMWQGRLAEAVVHRWGQFLTS